MTSMKKALEMMPKNLTINDGSLSDNFNGGFTIKKVIKHLIRSKKDKQTNKNY